MHWKSDEVLQRGLRHHLLAFVWRAELKGSLESVLEVSGSGEKSNKINKHQFEAWNGLLGRHKF